MDGKQRQGGPGAFGPYPAGNRWRILVRDEAGGAARARSYASREEAERWRKLFDEEIKARLREQGRTVADAIDAYDQHLEAEGHKQRIETVRRVRSFFRDDLDETIADLTPATVARIYDAVRTRKTQRWVGTGADRKLVDLGATISATTHRGMLTHTKTFLGWCVEKRWLKFNPALGIKPRGRLKHGREQLRIDEARKWHSKALELAAKEPGAVAALCALILGMRASEIISREVRDLDDNGRLLWIPESKTEAGRRTLEVPAELRDHLQRLGAGKKPEDLLFGEGHLRGWPLFWVKKICGLAGVKRVSAHSMRGLHATLAITAGATSHLVAGALGHESDAVTLKSYADKQAVAEARQRRGMQVLKGGKK